MINSMNILCKKELQNLTFTLGSCSHSSLSFITSLNSLIHFLNEITQNSKYSESLFYASAYLFKNIGTQCYLMLFFKLAIKYSYSFSVASPSINFLIIWQNEWLFLSVEALLRLSLFTKDFIPTGAMHFSVTKWALTQAQCLLPWRKKKLFKPPSPFLYIFITPVTLCQRDISFSIFNICK